MHDLTTRNDSTLLARWTRDGSEDAFAEIVHHYQRLVLGAALRRTGDPELARDVAQQVFATLAAKAHLLIGRTNLAGWLYYAASHIAARAGRAELRRRQHQQSLGEVAPTPERNNTHWPLVEEALGALGMTERESLVLHYFEDLSYPQIAAALGIEEAAARKRVSRALQSLEIQIRRRGLRGSATALLAGMVAQQCSVIVPSGLASAAIAASANSTAPWLLTLNTLMSHAPIKIAACASALAFAPLIYQMQANSTLRAEVIEHRRPRPAAVASASDPASLRQKQADLRTAIAAKRAARIASEERVGKLAALKSKLDQEVVMSFGTVESMVRKLARVLSTMEQLESSKGEKLEPGSEALKKRERHAREISQAVPEMLGIVREIPKLERDSAKAARFYATMFGEVAGFDEAARTTMEQDFATWLSGLQQEGLALAQRPQGKAPEWDARRNDATLQLFAALKAKLPSPAKGHLQWDDIIGIHASAADGMYEFLTTGNRP